jgi:hypothetical protein
MPNISNVCGRQKKINHKNFEYKQEITTRKVYIIYIDEALTGIAQGMYIQHIKMLQ